LFSATGLPGTIKLATKTPAATEMAVAKTNNNQLKAAVATVTKTCYLLKGLIN
jgi:hypothetical protein